jgi:hypothetical protein
MSDANSHMSAVYYFGQIFPYVRHIFSYVREIYDLVVKNIVIGNLSSIYFYFLLNKNNFITHSLKLGFQNPNH